MILYVTLNKNKLEKYRLHGAGAVCMIRETERAGKRRALLSFGQGDPLPAAPRPLSSMEQVI